MIARADKGNSLVILPIRQYNTKIQNFIQANKFHTATKHPTKHFQSQVRNCINNSNTLIPQDTKWRYTNMNPSAPTIKDLIKINKAEHPIRPVVNWRNAPAYKLATLLTHEIRQLAPLPNTYNINNTTDLISKLKDTPPLTHYALASLDITKFYTNVPVKETRNIICSKVDEIQLNPQTKHELMGWYDVITQPNYFSSNGEILIQGAPTSGLLAELFLQHLEHTHTYHT